MGLEHLISIEQIRARSYSIWDSEGRLEGHTEEYWFRAIAELESELENAWMMVLKEEPDADLVMPLPTISEAPQRHEAGKIDPDRVLDNAA